MGTQIPGMNGINHIITGIHLILGTIIGLLYGWIDICLGGKVLDIVLGRGLIV
jgi:hypothetical protein